MKFALALLVACSDHASAPPDAIATDPCCELGAELAPACIGDKLPAGTCAVFICPTFQSEACGAPKSRTAHAACPPCTTATRSICGC